MHYRMLLPILKHASPVLINCLRFGLSAPYLNTCTAFFITLSRLSAPYLNTCVAYPNRMSRLLGSISLYIAPTRLVPAVNQNQVLRHRRALGAWRSLLGSRLESAR